MAKDKVEWSKWYLVQDGGLPYIRRYRRVDGKTKWQRLDREQYAHLKTGTEFEAFMKRLNLRTESQLAKAKAAYDFKHAFITQEIKDEFRARLAADIPSQNFAQNLYGWLERNCLAWFINELGKPDPIDWKIHEKTWGLALMNRLEGRDAEKLRIWESPVHPDTIKKHKQVMNRFLAFLHEKLPREVPAIILDPVSKAQMRLYGADYQNGDDYVPGKFIPPEHWKDIEVGIKEGREKEDVGRADPEILTYVQLGYYYGLRRAECMAVEADELYEDHLEITRQLRSTPEGEAEYGHLKNRKPRSVPHWLIKPEKTYLILKDGLPIMHPDTFSKKFATAMTVLGYDYNIHDLRRTFITRAFREGHNPRDIQLAVGHSDLKTTQRYAQDDRELKKKNFVPRAD